jgi:hypothetical protein
LKEDRVLDPSKRRQKAAVEGALDGYHCPHGETVEVHWHPNRPDGWFDIEAHCPEGAAQATEIAAQALREFGVSSGPGQHR